MLFDPRHRQLIADALHTLHRNRLRSVLSGLGITIGVASLSAVLAVGDGVEQFARAQIMTKTSVHNVVLGPRSTMHHEGRTVMLREERRFSLDRDELAALTETLSGLRGATLGRNSAGEADFADSSDVPIRLFGVLPGGLELGGMEIRSGRDLAAAELDTGARVALVSSDLVERLHPRATGLGSVVLEGQEFEVVGTFEGDGSSGAIAVGLPWVARLDLDPSTLTLPIALFVARDLEHVDDILAGIEAWLDAHHPQWRSGAELVAQRAYLVEFRRGILLMKGFMAAITGISLLVGGIGIMNVLLVSVGERTREIGIRRALGARRGDIRRQLLAESVLLCAVGALLGATLGVSGAFFIAWILRQASGADLHVALTAPSILFAIGASVVVGLGFGTYPARRAARLSPVEAIRHE